ncbi:MAG: DUF1456 family protein [Mariprofundaceae bacterium]|nr:DUF1456 family protein [Mariprofundaceae bacterium]
MTNNDILRRIRYAFDFDDSKMIVLFGAADLDVTREQVSAWLKKDDDPALVELGHSELATFLNGLINDKRGRREGLQPKPEKHLNNNIVFRKLRIALNLKDDEIIEIITLAGRRLGKAELSAFFRKPDHKHYRACLDQVLRNFLTGISLKQRADKQPEPPGKPAFTWER